MLQLRIQHECYRTLHRIRAARAEFLHQIARRIDNEQIIAHATGHRVVAGSTIQRIVARAAIHHIGTQPAKQVVIPVHRDQRVGPVIAHQDVVGNVPGAVQRRTACQRQVLDFRSQNPRYRTDHGIGAAKRRLGRHICRVIDIIGIVADATDHVVDASAAVHRVVVIAAIQRVIAQPARQTVIAVTAGQRVVGRVTSHHVIRQIARAVDRGDPGQGQIFHIVQ